MKFFVSMFLEHHVVLFITKSSRPQKVSNTENAEKVLQSFVKDAHTSVRKVGQELVATKLRWQDSGVRIIFIRS